VAKVVIQLINDTGEVEDESTLIAGSTDQEAERAFARAVHEAAPKLSSSMELVVEFHYKDGDVGAYRTLLCRTFGRSSRGTTKRHTSLSVPIPKKANC